MRAIFSSRSIKGFAVSTVLSLSVLLSGCGMTGGSLGSSVSGGGSGSGGGITPTLPVGTRTAAAMSGRVHGGQQPVGNAAIQIYQVGTAAAYGSPATPLLTTGSVSTNAAGAFTIVPGNYVNAANSSGVGCTSGTYLYITAAGGYSDGNSGDVNNAITLGAALGLCDNVTTSTSIQINEVTTVAMAYALAQFSSGTTFGATLVSQPGSTSSAPADNFATSSTNVTGLANAMAIAQLLANTATGTSPGSSTSNSTSGAITVAVTPGSSGYTSAPTVAFTPAPSGGTTATGIVGMGIVGATITDDGGGYTTFPTLKFDPPDMSTGTGTLAAGTAIAEVTAFDLVTAGSGYTSAPIVTFSGGGATAVQATATATVAGGVVTSVAINSMGSGYTSAPTVTFTGGGATTQATGLGELAVTGVNVTTPGSNYTAPPNITFDGPNFIKTIASVAEGTGTLGTVTNVNVTAGSGYTTAPAVSFTGGGATTQATATASIGTQSVSNTATAEWWQINLIANILAECVNTISASSSGCTTLFSNVLGAAPKDTLQAALDLALNPTLPSANIAALVNNAAAQAPFQPYPSTPSAVTDFSVGIEYSPVVAASAGTTGMTTLLNQPSAIALDSLGNAWVANQPVNSSNGAQGFLVELTPTGVPIPAASTAGLYSSDYVVNSYKVGSTPIDMGGQYTVHSNAFQLDGLFSPSIDTSNNVWISDRQNSAMVKIPGSGITYSNKLSYTNGGTAAAVGTALPGFSGPEETYIDGSNNVWFQMTGANEATTVPTTPGSQCGTGSLNLSGNFNQGIGGFLGESTSTVKGGAESNFVEIDTLNPYSVVDPNVSDVTTSGSTQTPISGAPFLWSLGALNGTEIGPSTLVVNYTAGNTTVGCPTTLNEIAPATSSGITENGTTLIPLVALPNATVAGDMLRFMGTATDLTFDKSGNLWIANSAQPSSTPLDTQTTTAADEILSSISKVTPNYGSAFTSAQAVANFTYSVFHQVGSLYDGSTIGYNPQFLTSDGGGNIWYAMSGKVNVTTGLAGNSAVTAGSPYVNELSNAGASLSPYTVVAEGTGTGNTTGGYAGSVCTNCTFNGTTATFQRPNTLTLGRPAIDQSGDVWIPINGSGSTFLDLLVGIATPKANPDSLALQNSKFASMP